jgi:hypothetical protein
VICIFNTPSIYSIDIAVQITYPLGGEKSIGNYDHQVTTRKHSCGKLSAGNGWSDSANAQQTHKELGMDISSAETIYELIF